MHTNELWLTMDEFRLGKTALEICRSNGILSFLVDPKETDSPICFITLSTLIFLLFSSASQLARTARVLFGIWSKYIIYCTSFLLKPNI